MRPAVGWSSPAISPSSVDLPLPDCPAGTSSDTSVSTSTARPPLVRRMDSEDTLIMMASILHVTTRRRGGGGREDGRRSRGRRAITLVQGRERKARRGGHRRGGVPLRLPGRLRLRPLLPSLSGRLYRPS